MKLQEKIAQHLACTRFGCTARELSKGISEKIGPVHEHLLAMAALGKVTSRLVGREQVFMLADCKAPIPTPRELLDSAQAAVDAAPVPSARPPVRVKTVDEATWVPDAPRPALAGAPILVPRPAAPEVTAGPTIAEFIDAGRLPKPRTSLYAHVGGSITLNVFGKPVTARFTSVEQLRDFLDDLIEAGRAPEKG